MTETIDTNQTSPLVYDATGTLTEEFSLQLKQFLADGLNGYLFARFIAYNQVCRSINWFSKIYGRDNLIFSNSFNSGKYNDPQFKVLFKHDASVWSPEFSRAPTSYPLFELSFSPTDKKKTIHRGRGYWIEESVNKLKSYITARTVGFYDPLARNFWGKKAEPLYEEADTATRFGMFNFAWLIKHCVQKNIEDTKYRVLNDDPALLAKLNIGIDLYRLFNRDVLDIFHYHNNGRGKCGECNKKFEFPALPAEIQTHPYIIGELVSAGFSADMAAFSTMYEWDWRVLRDSVDPSLPSDWIKELMGVNNPYDSYLYCKDCLAKRRAN